MRKILSLNNKLFNQLNEILEDPYDPITGFVSKIDSFCENAVQIIVNSRNNITSFPEKLICEFTNSFDSKKDYEQLQTSKGSGQCEERRFFTLVSLTNKLAEHLATKVDKTVQEQTLLYNLLTQNVNLSFGEFFNVFDLQVYDFNLSHIENYSNALSGVAVDEQDAFLKLATRNLLTQELPGKPKYENLTPLEMAIANLDKSAIHINRGWTEFFQSIEKVLTLFQEKGVPFNNSVIIGEKVINDALSYSYSYTKHVSENLGDSEEDRFPSYLEKQYVGGGYSDRFGWGPYMLLKHIRDVQSFSGFNLKVDDYEEFRKLIFEIRIVRRNKKPRQLNYPN